jgi:hypothetical protein
MCFTVGWYDTGMLVDCTGALGLEATDEPAKTVRVALDTLERPTRLILDWRGIQGDPYRCHLCTVQVVRLAHPKLVRVAAVATNAIVSLWIQLLAQERDGRYLACTSLEQAILRFGEGETPLAPQSRV